MRRKIWVTGGTGLLGKALQSIQGDYPDKEFLFTGSKDCNLVSTASMYEMVDYVNNNDVDSIIHLAAVSGGIGLSRAHPATLLRNNVLMNLQVLEVARLYDIKKVVMTLSTGMYANGVPQPIKEEYIHNGKPDESNYGYSFAKRLIEPLIKAYREEYGLKAIGLVPNGIIGENGNYRENESTMVFSLIRRFYESSQMDYSPIVVWGDGSPLREYTYAKDLARAYMWCLDNYDDTQILHIGSTEEHSVKGIAYMIAEIMGIDKGRIVFDVSKPSGQFRKATDNSKFLKLSKFQYTPFRVALENTIKYFCENYDSGKLRL